MGNQTDLNTTDESRSRNAEDVISLPDDGANDVCDLDFTPDNTDSIDESMDSLMGDVDERPSLLRDEPVEQAVERARIKAEQEVIHAHAVISDLKLEMERRSHELASEKIKQMEQEMNLTISMMVEHALTQNEQEKLSKQKEMVESARLSPMYEALRELAFFKGFLDEELAEVLHVGIWHEKQKDEIILREGDHAGPFFVMLNGVANVIKRNRLIGQIRSGESFGEFAYIMGEQGVRHNDVVAKTQVEFMEFATERLDNASLEVRYKLAAAFAECQTRRLLRADELIVQLLADKYKRE